MKKWYSIIITMLLIVFLLYGRIFFLQDIVQPDKKKSEAENVQVSGEKQASSILKTNNKTETLYPPTTQTLILPVYNWPPFNVKESSGRWAGADIEITEAVLNRMGYRVQWVELAFARALEEMRSSNYLGMASCVEGGGREEYILFSDPVSSHNPAQLMDKILELATTDYDLKKQYDFKTIKIIKEYEDHLPKLPCEGAKIQQVLLNIFRNGVQAMQENGCKVSNR